METEPRVTLPVGILGVGVAVPSLRIDAAEIARAWSASARGSLAVPDADEDTLTLAWAASLMALDAAGVRPDQLDGLFWGTTRPPLAEGPSHVFLATALGIDRRAGGHLSSGSTHSGMDALVSAWDALGAGHVRTALVVASDALVPGPGSAVETTTGAGAAAYVLGPVAGAPGMLAYRTTDSLPVVDRYRGDGAFATSDTYDGRLFRDKVFMPLVSRVAAELCRAPGADGGTGPHDWSIADPDGRLAPALARSIGANLISAEVTGSLGDTGAPAAFLGAMTAMTAPGSFAMVAYGGGRATAVLAGSTREVPGARGALALLGAPAHTASYPQLLRSRAQLVSSGDPVPMGVPPGSAAFVRGNLEMLCLRGARCEDCGYISTPPSIHPSCAGCGGDRMTIVDLARAGTVETFVVNETMPPPFTAPLPLAVIDLDDGARVMLQGVSEDAPDLAIGDRVQLVLRRYGVERGIPVYGYKAARPPHQAGVAPSPHQTDAARPPHQAGVAPSLRQARNRGGSR